MPARAADSGVYVDVLVQPRASRVKIGPLRGDRVKVAVTAPPVDGAANQAVVEAFARALERKKRDVTITAGHGSRRKTVFVSDASAGEVEALWR